MFYATSPYRIDGKRYQFRSEFLTQAWRVMGIDPGHTGPLLRAGINDNATMNFESNDAEMIQLLDRIALQDQSALKALYNLCSSKLFGLAVRVVSNREWAEDVLQESFLSIWRGAGDYRASLSPPMAWMGLIVRSRGLDFLRRRASQRSHLTQEIDEVMADTLALDAPTPMDTAQASEQAWALHQCLVKLENRQREVVSLAYVRDLSHSELAQQLKLPLGTVKTWIRRGLEQLRVCMSRFA
jgi:RNA polymerase sigma factor (sigma-70 family)